MRSVRTLLLLLPMSTGIRIFQPLFDNNHNLLYGYEENLIYDSKLQYKLNKLSARHDLGVILGSLSPEFQRVFHGI